MTVSQFGANIEPKQFTCAWLFQIIFLWRHNLVRKFDIICVLETYLDSTVPFDDDNLVITEYHLVHSDRPSDTKSGSVCSTIKTILPIWVLYIGFLREYLSLWLWQ